MVDSFVCPELHPGALFADEVTLPQLARSEAFFGTDHQARHRTHFDFMCGKFADMGMLFDMEEAAFSAAHASAPVGTSSHRHMWIDNQRLIFAYACVRQYILSSFLLSVVELIHSPHFLQAWKVHKPLCAEMALLHDMAASSSHCDVPTDEP
jgi:hypothetical protein